MPEHDHRELTDAEKLNDGPPGNVAGKPIVEGTRLDDDNREQLPESEHDAVWAEATVTEHTHD